MSHRLSFFLACAFAAAAPLWNGAYGAKSVDPDHFPGWPSELEGHALVQRELGPDEAPFARRFPGRVGIFDADSETWILRWIARPTRELHSTADCYRSLGFKIDGHSVVVDESGREWGSFDASKRTERLRIFERIESADGVAWTDTSAWYWSVVTGHSQGPWWAQTRVITRAD